MQIETVELRSLELDLVNPLGTSVGGHARRPVLLVRVGTDGGGEGWGECVALAEPTYTEEYAGGAAAVLVDHLLPRLFAAVPRNLGEVRDRQGDASSPGPELPEAISAGLQSMTAVRGHPMARAAVEMALLDAWLRGLGIPLAAYLGASRSRIPAGATLGLEPTTAGALEAARRAVEGGYGRLKMKIAPGRDLGPVSAVRDAFPGVSLAVDANGTYRLDVHTDLQALLGLDALGLVALEQPLAPDDLVGHARLVALLQTPVLLDESVRGGGDLETVAALGACDGISIKPGRLGGILAARQLHDRCVELGLHCSIGGMLETGLGRAGSIAVGALAGFDLTGDLGGSERYFSPDLTAPHELVDGCLVVPRGPGLGVVPDQGLLARTSRLLASVRASR